MVILSYYLSSLTLAERWCEVILADASNTKCDITTNVDNNISGAGTVSLSNNEKEE